MKQNIIARTLLMFCCIFFHKKGFTARIDSFAA